MDLESRLKELSFEMMKVEMRKLDIENTYLFSQATNNSASPYATKQGYDYYMKEEDKKGYALSLQFNDLLLSNGKRYNDFEKGPDAVHISAEHLLYSYGLKYPISWFLTSEDKDGLHYGYDTSDKIDENHAKYIREVEQKLKEKQIDESTCDRLILAGEYYAALHKLLSQYYNNEDINALGENKTL